MTGLRNIEEFEVYQLCDRIRVRVRTLLERPCFRRDLGLRDQLDGSAESPCPNLAEGFGRFYPKDNARFVRVAKGSLKELKEHLSKVLAKSYIEQGEYNELVTLAESGSRAAAGYARYLESAKYPQPPSERRPRRRKRKRVE